MDLSSVLSSWPIHAIVALVAGIVILLVPRALSYAVAAYLLVIGTLVLVHFFYGHTLRAHAVIALVSGILVLLRPAVLSYVVGIYLILTGILETGMLRL